MSINDFEYVSEDDFDSIPDGITSTNGKIISKYLQSKENLNLQISESMNSSYDFGYSMGIADTAQRVIDWVKENRSLFDLGDDLVISRDHFDSDSLLKFLEEIKNERN